MRCYKLGYQGAAAVGAATIQIISSGRVKAITGTVACVTGAVSNCVREIIEVGTNALAEEGQSVAAPTNFACIGLTTPTAAAVIQGASENVNMACDYPVQAGQNVTLNITEEQIAGANAGALRVDLLVFVQ